MPTDQNEPKAKSVSKPERPIATNLRDGEREGEAYARILSGPFVTNAVVVKGLNRGAAGQEIAHADYVGSIVTQTKKINANDLTEVENFLFSQAITLNAWFAELSRKAVNNLNGGSEYRNASETYFKMAMKAQNQSRMTLETLAAVKNPPVVYAKQANISNGPQQVNNTLHTHAGKTDSLQNKVLEQSYEQRVDSPAQSQPSDSNQELETMDVVYGAEVK